MKKILKYWYLPLIVLVMIFVYVINNSSNNDNVYASNNVEAKEEKDEDKNVLVSKYYVDIKGEVKNPGIYEVNSGTRINEVIKLSGGLTKNADVSIINLSKKVTDEMVIKIYSKKEVSDAKNSISKEPEVIEIIKEIEKECVCPVTSDINTNKSKDGNVNINIATKEELMTIPRIGESKADAIIEYRNSKKFENIDEIKNIPGIGEKLFESIKEYIET